MKVIKLESDNISNRVIKIFYSIRKNKNKSVYQTSKLITNDKFAYILFGDSIINKYPHIKYNKEDFVDFIMNYSEKFKKFPFLSIADAIKYEIDICENIININENTTDSEIKSLLKL